MFSLHRYVRLSALVAAAMFVSLPLWADTTTTDQDRQKQIADLEAKIKALSSELDKIKAGDATKVSFEGLPPSWVSALKWRCIGPCTMGGRITAISVFEKDPSLYWVATASGGLLKTQNNGITFTHQFDKENSVSIGDVCVAPSDKNIVWVGTGEANPRNSVSFGDGVYKSIDGGKSWKHMGLRETFQIGKVVIHPTDPNIVYVGALGRLYGPNAERGVYKTTDGGATWKKVLYFDDNTGCIDLRMHPTDPNILIAGLWERKRDGFDSYVGEKPPDGIDGYDPIVKYGANGGIYRSTNAGETWTKMSQGLPTVKTGRIGLDWYVKDPNVVFAIIDTEKVGTGTAAAAKPYLGFQGEDAEGGMKVLGVVKEGAAEKAGLQEGDLITEAGGKKVAGYQDLADIVQSKKVGDDIEIKFKRSGEDKTVTAKLGQRPATAPPAAAPSPPAPTEPPASSDANQPSGGRQGGRTPPLGFGFRPEIADNGIRVGTLDKDSANAKAGLQEGDLIVAIEGKPLDNVIEAMRGFSVDRKAGDKVKVTIQRNEGKKELELTMEPMQMGGGGRRRTNPSRPFGAELYGQRENVQSQQGPDGYQTGGVYRSADGGITWTRINSVNPRPMYFSVVRVDPTDEQKLYVLGISAYASTDGGKTFKEYGNRNMHPDQHALWINPKDGRHMVIGTDGGFYVTYDRMENWEHLAHVAMGQFYHVSFDSKKPYNVYGGLQDNGSWGGPSRSLRGAGPINEDWITIGGGDGFVCRVDPDDPDLVYAESQDGNVYRNNLRTGDGGQIRYRPRNGEAAARFNWNTPFILSTHNPRIIYIGGDRVFRSLKQGADLKPISPEITKGKRGTATALAESAKNPDVLWVGSDDGALWVTRDGGQKWDNVYDALGAPAGRWVATIEASRFVEGRAYVCLDAHRSDDDKPYCFVTEDFGKSWKNITANLPPFGSTRCLREDPINQNLLLCGTEFAVFASIDRGGYWTKINGNLPTVAVHELAIHPTAGEVVAATHGRSLWILDITALRQMKTDAMKSKAFLYAPSPATKWRMEPSRGTMYGSGVKKFFGENPPPGSQIYYSLNSTPDNISLKVVDYAGKTVRELTAKKEPGLHRINWDLTRPSLQTIMGLQAGTQLPEMALRRPGGLFGQAVAAGTYRVVLTVDGQELSQPLRIEADPNSLVGAIAAGGEEEE